jgi:hypothetical protein
MLRVYRMAKMRDGVAIPEIEALLSRQMDGSLEAYAADAEHRSLDALRRRFGDDRAEAEDKTGPKSLAAQP